MNGLSARLKQNSGSDDNNLWQMEIPTEIIQRADRETDAQTRRHTEMSSEWRIQFCSRVHLHGVECGRN